MPIIAVIETIEDAMTAVAELEREGIARDSITVMSNEPLHSADGEGSEHRKSFMGLFAVAGGFTGACAAVLLTTLASRRVNLTTGGMPIVTPWAFGIIVFELTALGAILFSLARMIFEARLLRRNSLADYDEAVSEGKTVLSVVCKDDAGRESAKKILSRNGAIVREADQIGNRGRNANPA